LTIDFLGSTPQVEIFVLRSSSPRGVYFALPRSASNKIKFPGIICQGNITSKACFWDNQRGVRFDVLKGTGLRLAQFAVQSYSREQVASALTATSVRTLLSFILAPLSP
jgi:hypothetical protein